MENKEYNSKILEPNKENFLLEEFTIPKNYFRELKSEINLKKALGEDVEFTVPSNYFEAKRRSKKSTALRKAFYYISSSAAILIIGLLLFTPTDAECISFDCLLEETEISMEDLEYLEENEISLFSYEDE